MLSAAVPLSFFQKTLNLAFRTGTSKGVNRIGRYGNDSRGISFNGHSKVVLGRIWSFFLTSDGTETWPRFVTFVRMVQSLQDGRAGHKPDWLNYSPGL
jgi:hypothetical protein